VSNLIVLLNLKKVRKIQTSTEKTIPYPGFEPGTSGLAVGRHSHCTIWVGFLEDNL
jgi:hypothetical protein